MTIQSQIVPASQFSALPSFMAFDFNITKGIRLQAYKPLSKAELQKEAAKKTLTTVAVGAIMGALVGGAIGGGIYGIIALARIPAPIIIRTSKAVVSHTIFKRVIAIAAPAVKVFKTIGCTLGLTSSAGGATGGGAATGAAIGAGIGLSKSIYRTYQLISYANTIQTELCSEPNITRIQRVVTAFAHQQLGANNGLISCPITLSIIMIPIDLGCGTAETPHIFEANAILQAFKEDQEQKCPLCRTSKRFDEFEYKEEVAKKIRIAANNLFRNIELLLTRLPNNFLSVTKNFEKIETLTYLKGHIEGGKGLLEKTDEELITSMQDPTKFSESEKYALAFYLAQQFKPLYILIDNIYHSACHFLGELKKSDRIDLELYARHSTSLNNWYIHNRNDLIPQDCTIIRKIASLT